MGCTGACLGGPDCAYCVLCLPSEGPSIHIRPVHPLPCPFPSHSNPIPPTCTHSHLPEVTNPPFIPIPTTTTAFRLLFTPTTRHQHFPLQQTQTYSFSRVITTTPFASHRIASRRIIVVFIPIYTPSNARAHTPDQVAASVGFARCRLLYPGRNRTTRQPPGSTLY